MRSITGKVVSDKMIKTAVVEVQRLVPHPVYKKRVRRSKKFKAHNEIGAKLGDIVKIEQVKPISAQKHFKIVEVINGTKS